MEHPNYMYRVKNYTENMIRDYPNFKDQIEEEYYKLMIKIANDEYSDQDIRVYYSEVQKLIN